ncbi:MAG: preprotein translocase subunit SecA [Candidatus Levybacteria bacterium RIFCSPLOWO2_12_FULL_37_14]|nr:MAG: Protein translocase subunit SecA [Candidatus Levybacteria bacterium GW2011_GWA1_37_16]KKQ42406.1 MAG: Protein translocase subunit SecA [Candidatus Levybacteria bacterium GW2011_GWB1_37_8]OGH50081.1 MAG: preprotein translocase subunit SecA [Candidatus Levybacteria bacterium RIFCSPLOWO2_12_FULL_37_14]
MFNFIGKFFDSNEKEINKLKPLVSEINSFEEKFKKLKEKDFPLKTKEFKERIAGGESLDFLLPEAFALVREASRRSIGQRHYDVQLMAGITLAIGKIAEQKTGEGKTLSSIPALYLHSLTGKGVHLVTVNDYLARRDAGWMGPIFNLLGVTVSSIINDQSFIFDPDFIDKDAQDPRLSHLKSIDRKEAYKTDVTYGINSEFGFDYLRDNMAQDIKETVQRGYYYAVVDEVDSVLIDEARTPHIISAPDESPTQKYYEYAALVDKLNSDIDYKVDEKLRTAHLTDHGIGKIEKLYGVSSIYEKDFNTVYHLEAALKARTLFRKEKDYIVKDNQVILVDEFTGRLMMGRRLSEGLHQAIEAKENVPIQRESKTMATVSLQNYFRMYEKLAGMTGTAVTEAREFHKIYNLNVVVIPTNKLMIRRDHQDLVYKSGRAKYSAVANEIEKAYKIGQPVLVGTTSIDKNELISELLRRRGIKHEILNAKNHEQEARIISKAGEKGAVTVATNMAGRGVDIILGGETPNAEKESVKFKAWQKEHDAVVKLGGLYVIGTERHESRRIDNQLRGRSGRQGDPGSSRFFIALDDEIMKLFGGDTISGVMTRFNMPEDVPLQHMIVSRAIEQAQTKVEGFNFDIRKHLVDYDDVLNKQREIIYKRRRVVLENKESLEKKIIEKIDTSVSTIINTHTAQVNEDGKLTDEKIIDDFTTIIPFDDSSKQQLVKQLETATAQEQKINFLTNITHDIYEQRKKQLGKEMMERIERYVMLSVSDTLWMDHLDAVENLRGGIGLRGYGQRDPLVEYKNEAYTMFEQLINAIDDEIVHRIYKIQVQQSSQVHQHRNITEQPAGAKSDLAGAAAGISETSSNQAQDKLSGAKSASGGKKLGRNDPCYCGSGKKYKKCHYPN